MVSGQPAPLLVIRKHKVGFSGVTCPGGGIYWVGVNWGWRGGGGYLVPNWIILSLLRATALENAWMSASRVS